MESILQDTVHEINNANNIAVLNLSLFRKVVLDLLPLLDEYGSSHPECRLGNLPLEMVRKELPAMISGLESAAQRIRVATMKVGDVAQQAASPHG